MTWDNLLLEYIGNVLVSKLIFESGYEYHMTSIRDVAKKACVSITTVSKAMNGYTDISQETCRRVIETAAELGYRPNAIARSLVKRESRVFGYVVSGMSKGAPHTIVQESMMGVYDFIRSIDYEMLMFNVDSTTQLKKSYLQFAMEHSLAGIIIQGIRTDDAYYREVANSTIPCVLIDIPADSVKVGSVSTDNYVAAREAVGYLIDCGHSNIAYVNGKDAAAVSVIRYEAYVSMMREKGMTVKSDYILGAEFDEETAYQKMLGFLKEHPEVTAVFCASDLMAIGVLRAARELNIDVPSQLSVIGFDDILISSYITPTLTTVHQNFYDMGFEAAKMLYDIVIGHEVPHTKKIPHHLVLRKSTQ
jgi:LacI family transcriptional regulator